MENNGRDMVETLIRLAFASAKAKKKEQDKEEEKSDGED